MPTFGDYETLSDEPVAERKESGHVTTLWKATKSGANDGKTYAVKVYSPVRRTSREGAAEEDLEEDPCLGFLEGVKRLGKARQEGGRCLAKVHGLGRTEGAAWFAMEFRERGSMEDFIARKLSPGSAGLRHVVGSVVTGCLALKRSSGRSHGGLKPSNVLLASEGPALPKTALELTDSYPASLTVINRLGAEDRDTVETMLEQALELQDLRCLGELILQLVEQRQIRSAYDYNYPIQISPAWTGLGKDGEWWLELCNRLLDPHLAPGTITLESLASEIGPSKSWDNIWSRLSKGMGEATGGLLRMFTSRKPSTVEPLDETRVAARRAVLKKVFLAVAGVVLALGLISVGTVVAKKLKAGSAAKRQQNYETATNAAGIALADSDFTEAIRQARNALESKPDDPAAVALLKQAQLEQTAEEARQQLERFQAATNAAQTALASRNYSEVVRQADLALEIRPDDPVASGLKAQAQQALSSLTQAERQYQSATNAAVAAWRDEDYAKAVEQAGVALGLKPDDPVATKLQSDARAALAQAERNYQAATNNAGIALNRRDYGEAIRQADAALGIKPDDPAATKLKEDARDGQAAMAQAERNYQSATNAAGQALRARDYPKAIEQADVALGFKPDDRVATQLKTEAQAGQAALAEAEKNYQAATNAAGLALRDKDYPKAIEQANVALDLRPNDRVATQLKADAQAGQTAMAGAERNYQAATNAAGLALRDKDYPKAIEQADMALGLKPNDRAATKLKTDAQAGQDALVQAEKDFQSATNAATAALRDKNYLRAIEQANAALNLRPNDRVAAKLKADAQAGQAALVELENNYRAATNAAMAALRARNYPGVIEQANVALGLKPNDRVATTLIADARAGQNAMIEAENNYRSATNSAGTFLGDKNYAKAFEQANLALGLKPNDPTATALRNEAQSRLNEIQAVVANLDAKLEQLCDQFNVKVPDWLRSPGGRKAGRERSLSFQQKDFYMGQVNALRTEYDKNGLLTRNDRNQILDSLDVTISRYP